MNDRGARPVRALLAVDSDLLRDGLLAALANQERVQVIGACLATDTQAAVDCLRPQVVVSDGASRPANRGDDAEADSDELSSHCDVGVLVIGHVAHRTSAQMQARAGSGGRAYLLEERVHNRTELIQAIEAVAEGRSPLASEVAAMAHGRSSASPLAELTAREHELLGLIAQGMSNGAIADTLVLTKRGVEKHVHSIYFKLGLPDERQISRRVMAALIFLRQDGG